MKLIEQRYQDRLAEIESYLDFLDELDKLIKSGMASGGQEIPISVTVTQQRILYSSVYLQLYNLVEATVTNCLEAVSQAALSTATWLPGDLTDELRREWVKHIAKTNLDMGPEKRLQQAIALCDHMVASLPVLGFDIEKGGGGNWDEDQIKKIAERLGFQLKVKKATYEGVKKVMRDDMGAMALIVSLRNKLAHGSLSFVECGRDDTPTELRTLTKRVTAYMGEVVAAFVAYLDGYEYLRPERRPAHA